MSHGRVSANPLTTLTPQSGGLGLITTRRLHGGQGQDHCDPPLGSGVNRVAALHVCRSTLQAVVSRLARASSSFRDRMRDALAANLNLSPG
jgi:hypothetical protein